MAISIQQFRADFPEFTSTETYPNSSVQFWMNTAYRLLNPGRWSDLLDLGAELFVAHHLVIEGRALQDAQNGATPGTQVGPVNSKSVDKVSISYDTGVGIEEKAGHWNLSIYGTRFIRLAKMFGAGPVQIGIGVPPSGSGGGWPGPDTTPGFSNFS